MTCGPRPTAYADSPPFFPPSCYRRGAEDAPHTSYLCGKRHKVRIGLASNKRSAPSLASRSPFSPFFPLSFPVPLSSDEHPDAWKDRYTHRYAGKQAALDQDATSAVLAKERSILFLLLFPSPLAPYRGVHGRVNLKHKGCLVNHSRIT